MTGKAQWYILVYTMLLLRLSRALKSENIEYALVGGHAVSLHGAVRGTIDIDIVLPFREEVFVSTARALESIGLQSRLPVTPEEIFSFRQEYIEQRNLKAWAFHNPGNPIELVDIVITHDLQTMKTKDITVQGEKIQLLALDDLIAMKRDSGREQDLADIQALEKLR